MSMLLSEGNDEESMYLLPCVVLYADSLHTHSFSLQLHENWFSWRFGNHPISLATEMDEEMKDIKAENFLSELGYWNAPTVLHLPSTFPEVPLPRITAASSIGKETAIAFAEAGASGVMFADHDEKGTQEAAEQS
ncbi:hypothetical protein F4821DRAFT_260025 [Hypoxylon rubiginosum]|uniref:Uncharacterized protein n=1 Tax=Hypoxylon rubiginosum TaxID=110542 RepID=A0ACC0D1A3_9PEZI|nr:hypothetical protein F4821DRAFT_260025 [Hypoxylon rubiginosum]